MRPTRPSHLILVNVTVIITFREKTGHEALIIPFYTACTLRINFSRLDPNIFLISPVCSNCPANSIIISIFSTFIELPVVDTTTLQDSSKSAGCH